MWTWLLKRSLMVVVTLFGIAVLSFLVVTGAPGDPAALKANAMGKGRATGISEFTTRKNRELFFLDRPKMLNLSPATRTTTVAERIAALDAPIELERNDARSRLTSELGTAALEDLVVALAHRTLLAAGTRKLREDDLAALAAAGDDEAALRPVLARMAARYPDFEPRLPHEDGKAPAPHRYAEVWARQRQAMLDDAEASARRVLEVLSSNGDWTNKVAGIFPPDRGGPQVEEATPLPKAVGAWTAWWLERSSAYEAGAVRAAAQGYLADPEDAKFRAMLETAGPLAAPWLMDALEDADEGSDAEREAAAGLALVCKKPWVLSLTDEERTKFEVEYQDRRKLIEDDATTNEATKARKLAALGATVDDYISRKRDEELDRRRHAWSSWWYRAEEYYVEFGPAAQAGRAFSQTQFGRWMSRFVRFDFGESYKHKRPVAELLWEKLKPTLCLNIASLILIYLFALPIGIFSAVRRDTVADRASTVMLFVLYSIPSFWAGAMLIMLLTGEPFLNLFPAYGIESLDNDGFSAGQQLWDWLTHGFLPVVCLTYGGIAYLARQMRAGLLDVIRQDYIRTAKAKGLSEGVVIYKHALRNGLIPILTLMAGLLPVLFGGSVIIEQIFTIDGLGKLAFDAVLDRDYPVIMANLVISGFLTLVGILLTDIAYTIVDPRIEFR